METNKRRVRKRRKQRDQTIAIDNQMPTPTNNSGLRDKHSRECQKEQVHEKTDLELVTWLVIKEDKA